ncbi:MAG TPA: NADP-dependent oxidoreductase [Anaeromyxobacteraceae bacterium]|nr:NADP-dependent oxidoreductase [Anaeromyxobacteraceae bacterium]
MAIRNRQWLLASRPKGPVEPSNFRLVEAEAPAPRDGQVLVKVLYLSLDPYMRARMDEARSYAPSQKLDEVMIGGTVGEVIESRNPRWPQGQMVVGAGGWQEYFVSDGSGLLPVDARTLSPSVYLGAVGMPGITAWYGLGRIGRPKAGETVVVSAAAGAVGSAVGQLAKLAGCRAVGVAGGPDKCQHVVKELGLDACVDYRAADFREAFRSATPDGIDVVFENVGGAVFEASLSRMNAFGRVALCGLIAGYDGQDMGIRNARSILMNRLTVQGFIVSDHMDLWPQAMAELGALVSQGKLRYRETVAQGIESAPRAFLGLLRGENLGKQLVRM